ITSDEVLTWNQIYQATADALNVEPNIVHVATDYLCNHESSMIGTLLGDKAHSAIFDNTKIKTLVPDFEATIPFREGIKRTLAWFDADPKRQIVKEETNEMMNRIIEAYER
ncbi:MAG TPA: hypothetical protein VEF33_00175, partial [Syntrophales bacterium]|nr:hypothetical protein [Syntrophales bacterium]